MLRQIWLLLVIANYGKIKIIDDFVIIKKYNCSFN